MATATALSELRRTEFLDNLDTLVDIYASAMDADAALLPGRMELMRRHVDYAAFQALQARTRVPAATAAGLPAAGLVLPRADAAAGPVATGPVTAGPVIAEGATWPIVGFAYGFHGQRGQWWYDAVWNALSHLAGPGIAAQWLTDSIEVAEVHVHKDHQHSGIGTSMLMMLTGGRPERTAVLSTPDRETTARRLYRRLGFTDLLTSYSFPGGSPPYAVMGAELPLRDAAAAAAPPRSASPSVW